MAEVGEKRPLDPDPDDDDDDDDDGFGPMLLGFFMFTLGDSIEFVQSHRLWKIGN